MPGLNYGNKYTLSSNRDQLMGRAGNRKTIYVFDKDENLINQYPKIEDAVIAENINKSTLKGYIKNRFFHKGKYYSYNKDLPPNTKIF